MQHRTCHALPGCDIPRRRPVIKCRRESRAMPITFLHVAWQDCSFVLQELEVGLFRYAIPVMVHGGQLPSAHDVQTHLLDVLQASPALKRASEVHPHGEFSPNPKGLKTGCRNVDIR